MSVITYVTPALRFNDDLSAALYRCGYDSHVDSLHQDHSKDDQWCLHLTVVPHTLTGKCARISLNLDNIAENGRYAHVSLDHLKLEPRDSRKVRDLLRSKIEERTFEEVIYATTVAYIVTIALDDAGISG